MRHHPTKRQPAVARSVTAILDAALAALTEDPDVSMAEIARRAGVVRATVYVHFPTREALGRYRALVALNTRLGPEHMRALHAPVAGTVRPLLERGRSAGAFNPDLTLDWMLTVVLDLIHAASREVTAGRLPEAEAERALIATVTGALSPRGTRI